MIEFLSRDPVLVEGSFVKWGSTGLITDDYAVTELEGKGFIEGV